MFDIVLFITLALPPPTTTHCDLLLDDAGQVYEVCWEDEGRVESEVKKGPVPIP